jgi:hypothetical protein
VAVACNPRVRDDQEGRPPLNPRGCWWRVSGGGAIRRPVFRRTLSAAGGAVTLEVGWWQSPATPVVVVTRGDDPPEAPGGCWWRVSGGGAIRRPVFRRTVCRWRCCDSGSWVVAIACNPRGRGDKGGRPPLKPPPAGGGFRAAGPSAGPSAGGPCLPLEVSAAERRGSGGRLHHPCSWGKGPCRRSLRRRQVGGNGGRRVCPALRAAPYPALLTTPPPPAGALPSRFAPGDKTRGTKGFGFRLPTSDFRLRPPTYDLSRRRTTVERGPTVNEPFTGSGSL